MKPQDKVGVCYSGGVSSTSLLHLISAGLQTDHKKLLFLPLVIHIGTLRRKVYDFILN